MFLPYSAYYILQGYGTVPSTYAIRKNCKYYYGKKWNELDLFRRKKEIFFQSLFVHLIHIVEFIHIKNKIMKLMAIATKQLENVNVTMD